MDSKTYTGVVKRVMDKGFGFIFCEELKKDIFYHNNDLTPSLKAQGLREGIDKVTFSIKHTDRGDAAANVTLISDDSDESTEVEVDQDDQMAA